jgi:hypothetical protein
MLEPWVIVAAGAAVAAVVALVLFLFGSRRRPPLG